jgi:hypothetical protein
MDANWRPGPSTRFPWLVLFSEHFPRHPCSLMGHRLLVSGFKNNIEKFNVEPGGQNGGRRQNRREMVVPPTHPLASAEEHGPF